MARPVCIGMVRERYMRNESSEMNRRAGEFLVVTKSKNKGDCETLRVAETGTAPVVLLPRRATNPLVPACTQFGR
jgi:hypothetical protein